MQDYLWISIAGAFALSAASVLGKVILRYRICDAGLITWIELVVMAVFAAVICTVLRISLPFEVAGWMFLLSHLVLLAGLCLNKALQEGDASQVVPLLGLKIPLAGVFAVLLLNEQASVATWTALIGAGAAVALFGAGRQQVAQGGHGYKPIVPILFAFLASLFFALSDIVARISLDGVDPIALVLWMAILAVPAASAMLLKRKYKVYRVTLADIGLIFLRGMLVLVAVICLYTSFNLAGGVIGPNVVYGSRGAFALFIGYILNKSMKVSIERQGWEIYLLRAIGTGLLFVSLLLVVL